ncbi:MAG TPA: hypothetical protein ENJ84_04395 [Gammaproteobacteria bacterium]|nr:hypothetical protein [Gammaproteobacteria bacterium]
MLIFVYNADSGLFNTLTDMAHKIFSPSTYACQLCKLTYGPLSMRTEWRDFISSMETGTEFLHRDEFESQYGCTAPDLPVVYQKHAGALRLCVSATEINDCTNIAQLKSLIQSQCL